MARRPWGEGSITAAGPGRWKVRIDLGTDPAGKRQRLTRTVAGTKRDAARWLAEERARIGRGPAPTGDTAGSTTVAELHRLTWPPHDVSPRTLDRWAHEIEALVLPRWGSVAVRAVDGRDLSAWYRELDRHGVSRSNMAKAHQALSHMMRHAVEVRWIDANPTLGHAPPKPPKAEIVAPTLGELALLRASFDVLASRPRGGLRWATWFRVALLTGLRRGEMAALRWDDIDMDGRTLRVDEAATSSTLGLSIGPPKTTTSYRRVPLIPATVEALDEWRRSLPPAALGPRSFVLTPDGRQPTLPSNASHEFAKLVRSIGLDHLNLHGLRHGTATYMIAAGFDAVTVASILGNTSQVLLDTYADALNPRRLQAAEALGRIWEEAR